MSPADAPPTVIVAIDLRSAASSHANALAIADAVRRDAGPIDARIRFVEWRGGEPRLVDVDGLSPPEVTRGLSVSLAVGGIAGSASASRQLIAEGVAADAAGIAFVAGEHPGLPQGWTRGLFAPIVDGDFDYVSLAYDRHALDGALNTGIVYPLTRALYGAPLRQPLGGEVALSMRFAKALLADADWRRDPAAAGGDAWLVASALTSAARVCQVHLGHWPRPSMERSDPSEVLARVLGLVLVEAERHASRWQRVSGPRVIPTFGARVEPEGPPPQPDVAKLVESFRLGLRELPPIWSQVLPPGALFDLERAGARGPQEFRIGDRLWARVVYDFAVAHSVRALEPHQLLRSMTPLYLGWVASFANELAGSDTAGAEERVERLCAVFESEKRYLVRRWRWPESFTP